MKNDQNKQSLDQDASSDQDSQDSVKRISAQDSTAVQSMTTLAQSTMKQSARNGKDIFHPNQQLPEGAEEDPDHSNSDLQNEAQDMDKPTKSKRKRNRRNKKKKNGGGEDSNSI